MKKLAHLSGKNKTVMLILSAIIIPLLLGGIALSAVSLNKNNPAPTPPLVPKEVTSLIGTVGKHTILPADETPTVATVTNVSQLQDQPFFAKARNGDKVLMYLNARKAVLYRPATGEVVQISPLEIVSPQASDSAQAPESALFNASSSAQQQTAPPVLKVKF